MRVTFLFLFICHLALGQETVKPKNDSTEKSILLLPSYRYINKNNHLVGLIVTNVKFDQGNDSTSQFKFWIEPMFQIKESFAGKVAVSNKWVTKGFFKAIEPFISFKQFPYFKNEKLDYILNYKKYRFDTKFYLTEANCECFTFTISRIGINERFALFSTTTIYSFKNLTTNINRIELVKSTETEKDFGYAIDFKIDNAQYKDVFDRSNKFTRMDFRYSTYWKIGNHKNFNFSFYLGYFLQNDNRQARNFSNVITKGSISLSQQGFNDYGYDENFVSRASNAGLWDNQISTSSGGGFKYASSINSSLGMTNDLAYAINTSVNLPGTSNWLKTAAYFDIGAYKVDKINYLYSAGISLDFNEILQLYVPLVNHSAIAQNYRDSKLSFFERINYQVKLVHHFTNRT